jgi:hypothetical protein
MIESVGLYKLTCDVCGKPSNPASMEHHWANGWRWNAYIQGPASETFYPGYKFYILTCGDSCRVDWEQTCLIPLYLRPAGERSLKGYQSAKETTKSNVNEFARMADYMINPPPPIRIPDPLPLSWFGRLWLRLRGSAE